MVSQDSRARILTAAAREFAERGFEGAKVDRIAARARVNKAMLYYHFANKAGLYAEILRDVFGAAADAVEAVPAAGGDPEAQLRAFVVAIATGAVARPHFPPIWLREIAEGGRHLDQAVIGQMHRVMRTLQGILGSGQRLGVFRDVPALVVQMAIAAPLLLFTASAPVRARLKGKSPFAKPDLTPSDVIAYIQDATLAAVRRRLS